MKIELELKNKPRVFGNMFKSVSNKMKEGKKIKSAVGKVLDKYLLAQKQQKEKKRNLLDMKQINRKNEVSILKFNDNIKQINYLLTSKEHETWTERHIFILIVVIIFIIIFICFIVVLTYILYSNKEKDKER